MTGRTTGTKRYLWNTLGAQRRWTTGKKRYLTWFASLIIFAFISILAFLDDDDVNVIVLDWSRLANRGYATARNGVTAVGEALGHFAMWLSTFGLTLDRIHLVGFSLGGHLVGNAGKITNGRIARITGINKSFNHIP